MAKTRRVKKLRGGNQYGPDTETLMRRMQNILNGRLDLYKLNITSLPPLPPTLLWLDVSGTQLTSLPELPPALKELDANHTRITSLPELPPTLEVLDVANTDITSLPKLPPTLEVLDIYGTPITSLPKLPRTLEQLDVSYTRLITLPTLPNHIEELETEGTSIPEWLHDEPIAEYNARIKKKYNIDRRVKSRARDLSAAQQTVFRPGTTTSPALQKVMDANILNSILTPMLTGKSEDYSNAQPEQKPVMQRLKKKVTGTYGGKTKKNKRI